MNTNRRLTHHSTTSYVKPDNNGNNNGNIWSSILKGVATSRTVHTKNVLVLGDQSTGKSTLIQHLHSDTPSPLSFSQASSRGLNGTEPTKTKHLALGFSYTTVYDEDNEGKLGVDGWNEPAHSLLLLLRRYGTIGHLSVIYA
jgi:dynein light intermediate chain 1